ncbi:helix-turn-helix domain-containing protein [Methylobacterium sp. CM6257]
MILDKSSQGTTLYARGRDIEEIETALSFDRASGTWLAQGPASEVRRSDERQAILSALAEAGRPLSPAELSVELGVPSANIRQLLLKMGKAGEVSTRGRGMYVLADASGEAALLDGEEAQESGDQEF